MHESHRLFRLPFRCGVVLAWLLPLGAAAGEWQAAAGFAAEVDQDHAPVATLGYLTDHRFPVEIVGGYIGSRRIDSGPVDPTWFLGADVRWAGDWWFVGGGLAFVSERSEILSSDYQFMTLAGLRWSRWLLTLRHLSNAGLEGRNRGETFMTLGYAW